ncbi:aminotransferase class I/II-fold pyridoxal phosphate-dependent enzyme [bacterium]|nr:aminotransferase class I/II-fold pyridoxal phosphate-dependent enzyme [bacterium]
MKENKPHGSFHFSSRTDHFVLPTQWASMRIAKEKEKRTGKRIIHFEKGDYQGPDFDTPEHLLKETIKAIKDGCVRYNPGSGIDELRQAIADKYTKERNRPTSPEEVIVTAGAKHSLTMNLLTFLDDGDEVIFPNPGYPPDEVWAKFSKAVIKHAPLTKGDWQLDIKKLEQLITPRTKLIIINTPQRPNGQLVNNLEEIAEMLERHPHVMVISDEIFSEITYGKPHKSISMLPGMRERTIIIDTFSKTWAMTGWRIGWTVAPAPVIEKLNIFLQDSITNVAEFIQKAAYAALTGPQDWVLHKKELLLKKRNMMVKGLNQIKGVKCDYPDGTFYVLADITGTGLNSQEFTDRLLERANVAVVAGTAFGTEGEGYVRITFACPDEDIKEGLDRMKAVDLS